MFKRVLSSVVLVSFLSVFSLNASAGMISSEQAITQAKSHYDKAQLSSLLERADVQAKLESMGVDKNAVEKRIASLTDGEVAELNQNIENLPAGALTVDIVALAAAIFIILIITDAMGVTDAFTFINPAGEY